MQKRATNAPHLSATVPAPPVVARRPQAASARTTNGGTPGDLEDGREHSSEPQLLQIGTTRTCDCKASHICCLTAKEWLKNQMGVWQFTYEKRDVRDKSVHPATYPIALPRRLIEQFTHQGELVLDPFVGSGTTLVAAQDANRNAVGFDLSADYVELSSQRLDDNRGLLSEATQVAIHADAHSIPQYIGPESASLVVTSPPYANLLNRKRKNKSRRDRKNDQLVRIYLGGVGHRLAGSKKQTAFRLGTVRRRRLSTRLSAASRRRNAGMQCPTTPP